MEVTPKADIETQPNVDFLFRLGGESLSENEVNDIRRLSLKYKQFALLRFVLLAEVEPISAPGVEMDTKPALNYFDRLRWEVSNETSNPDDQLEGEDLETANQIFDKLAQTVREEAALLMDLYTVSITKNDILERYKDLLNRTRVVVGGDKHKPKKNSITETEMLSEGDTKSRFDGLPAFEYNRKTYKGRKNFQYGDQDSLTQVKTVNEKDKQKDLLGIKSEIKAYITRWINNILQGSAEEVTQLIDIEYPKDKKGGLRVSEENGISIGGNKIYFSLSTDDVDLGSYNGIDGSISLPEISHFEKSLGTSFKGYHLAEYGYYHLFALVKLHNYIDSVLSTPERNTKISTPFENPLGYLLGDTNVGKAGANDISIIHIAKWFMLSRYHAPNILLHVYQKDGMGPLLLTMQKRKYENAIIQLHDFQFDKLELESKKGQDEENGIVQRQSVWERIAIRIKSLGGSNEPLNFSNTNPARDEGASLTEQALSKSISFEIEQPWDLDIDYLATYPDDGKPLSPYEIPKEIIGTEYLLKSRRPIPVENRGFRVWAPINSKIISFTLFDSFGKEYRLGKDYELEIDERGYYHASFKFGFSVPKNVKYSYKFTLEPEKVDRVVLDSQGLLNLEIVAEKLGDSGYTVIADKLKSEIKSGKVIDTSDIEKIVFESSLYYYAELYSPGTLKDIRTNHYPFLPNPTDNGKLVVICSHSALLMRSILSDVFPSGEFHRTSLLVLKRTPLGHRLYANQDFHSTLRGRVKGKNISLDATPSKPALRISTQTFINIKELFIGVFARRKKGLIDIVSRSLSENSFDTFVVVNEDTRAERTLRVNQQYFSGLYKVYLDTISSYEHAITGTVQFIVPRAVIDISEMLKDIEKEFKNDKPELAQFNQRVKDLKQRLEFYKGHVLSDNRRNVLLAKEYLGNATGYIGFLEELLDTLEKRLG